MDNFLQRNISVVLEYIVFSERIQEIVDRFKGKNAGLKYVVLIANKDTIIERDNLRDVDCRMGQGAVELLNKFTKLDTEDKYIINTT